MIPKEPLHRRHLGSVALGGGGSMSIDVANLRGVGFSIAKRDLHRLERAGAMFVWGSDVMRIACCAVADDLSVDTRTAAFCVFEFLEHKDRRALREHKAVAIAVERA